MERLKELFERFKITKNIDDLDEIITLISKDSIIEEKIEDGTIKLILYIPENEFYYTYVGDMFYCYKNLIEDYINHNKLSNLFTDKVILFRNKEELREACETFPNKFNEKYFHYYFEGKYNFPMLVWDIDDSLKHQGLPNINNWDKKYIELIKNSIYWNEFKEFYKKELGV